MFFFIFFINVFDINFKVNFIYNKNFLINFINFRRFYYDKL